MPRLLIRTSNKAHSSGTRDRGQHILAQQTVDLLMLALASSESDQFAQAIPLWQAVVRLRPVDGHAWISLGWALANERRFEEAIRSYEKGVTLMPDAASYFTIAKFHWYLGNFEAARLSAQQALRLQPDYAEATLLQANALAAQGKHKKAVAQFQALIRVNAAMSSAHISLAESLYEMGCKEKACIALQNAKQIIPRDADLAWNAAQLYLKMGNDGAALEECQLLKELHDFRESELRSALAPACLAQM
jgi:tetratricopeptide (TPR) repeat protein